jgi:hypothetical protein
MAAAPHAPTSICGVAPSYDANGNMLAYDPDGTGPVQSRSFTYDGENRQTSMTSNRHSELFVEKSIRHEVRSICRVHRHGVFFGVQNDRYWGATRETPLSNILILKSKVLLGKLAGGLGFEPRLAESESAVLPLDDPPMLGWPGLSGLLGP